MIKILPFGLSDQPQLVGKKRKIIATLTDHQLAPLKIEFLL
jgi:hypothetical protein